MTFLCILCNFFVVGLYFCFYCSLFYWKALCFTLSVVKGCINKCWLIEMLIDKHTHRRASARWALVVKKNRKRWDVSLDKTLIPWLGSCRALWSYSCNLDLQPIGRHWSPLYGEKPWNVFLKKLNFFATEERKTYWMTWRWANYQDIFYYGSEQIQSEQSDERIFIFVWTIHLTT